MTEESYIPHYYFFATEPHPKNSDIKCGVGMLKEDSECTYFLYEEKMGKSKEYTDEAENTIQFSSQSIVLIFDLPPRSSVQSDSAVHFSTDSYIFDQNNSGPCWICDKPEINKAYVVRNSGTQNNGLRRVCNSCIQETIHVITQIAQDNSAFIFSHSL